MRENNSSKADKLFVFNNLVEIPDFHCHRILAPMEGMDGTWFQETSPHLKSSNTLGVMGILISRLTYYISMIYANSLRLTRMRFSANLGDIRLQKKALVLKSHSWLGFLLGFAILPISGCAVRRTTKVHPPEISAPALDASAKDLVGRANAMGDAVRTLTATVDFQPTAGSVYSGVIKEYHDVKGFILVKKPALIRVIGQAPVIRTDIFDMVSDGETFKLSIPPKHKFIEGPTEFTRPAKNAFENLRPQHILEALLVPPINAAQDKISTEEAEEAGHRYYVLTVFGSGEDSVMFPLRKFWFDRSNLDIARLQFYGAKGNYLEDVKYSKYQDFGGTHYPALIQINRPVEDYSLAIAIQKATFNQDISSDKFELKKPEGAELVHLSALSGPEVEHGK